MLSSRALFYARKAARSLAVTSLPVCVRTREQVLRLLCVAEEVRSVERQEAAAAAAAAGENGRSMRAEAGGEGGDSCRSIPSSDFVKCPGTQDTGPESTVSQMDEAARMSEEAVGVAISGLDSREQEDCDVLPQAIRCPKNHVRACGCDCPDVAGRVASSRTRT